MSDDAIERGDGNPCPYCATALGHEWDGDQITCGGCGSGFTVAESEGQFETYGVER